MAIMAIDKDTLKNEIERIEDELSMHSRMLSQWKDELKVELERQQAIFRNLVREESKIDSLTIKLKELEERLRGENVFKESENN